MKKGNLLVWIILLFVFMAGCSQPGKTTASLPEKQQTPPKTIAMNSTGTEQNNTDKQVASSLPVSPSEVAAPFQAIAEDLLKTCDFPVILPKYLPLPDKGKEWVLIPEVKTGFTLEINQQTPGAGHGTWAGAISGNIGQPFKQAVEKQFESDNIGVNSISLPDGIEGQEYLLEGYPNIAGSNAVTWESGQWSYFVTAFPGEDSGSTVDYAHQIIKTIGNNGQALPGSQGKLYYFYSGNMPLTKIYWELDNAIWYELDWRGDPNDAIKSLQSMVYVEESDAK